MTSPGEPPDSGQEPSLPSAGDAAGGFDLGGLLSQIGEMQQSLQDAQESVASEVVEGTAGGGAVRVQVSGGLEFESVTIAPEVVDPDDIELLQDLVLAAVRDAIERANEVQRNALGAANPIAGLGELGGLFGGDVGGNGPEAGRA